MTVGELILELQKNHKPDDPVAAALWFPEDVIENAPEGVTLTDEQIADVLLAMHDQQDGEFGITCENCRTWIKAIVPPPYAVNDGVCSACGREYSHNFVFDCISDDCPSNNKYADDYRHERE